MVVRERHNVAFMVGILIGALAASIGALLLTPLSGRETREQLAAKVGELRGQTEGVATVEERFDDDAAARLSRNLEARLHDPARDGVGGQG